MSKRKLIDNDEPFTKSKCTCNFCQETHQLMGEWDTLKPETNLQKNMYQTINRLEKKYSNDVIKEFYDTGKLKFQKYYKGGKKVGCWEKWYPNGQLKYKGSYKDGKKTGKWKLWDENGKLITTYYYRNGRKIRKI